MAEKRQPEEAQRERRDFLASLGSVIAGAVAAAAGAVPSQATAAMRHAKAAAEGSAKPAIPEYDWTRHRWAFGVDATKCIGCLRCV